MGSQGEVIREWKPCNGLINIIPLRVQNVFFSNELHITCIDVVKEYIALGTSVGLVYWYHRGRNNIQRLRCEQPNSAITIVKIVDTVDFMVAAGNQCGQVTIFQIPKEVPDSLPDSLKPESEKKTERYTVDMHKCSVTALEWSRNGMKLFSGDNNGVIIGTEIDFYMHLCKSVEIVDETHEVVQLSYWQGKLLISTVYRTILCEKVDGKWNVSQIGNKERKSLCRLGAVFQWSVTSTGATIYCCRPGLRLWQAGVDGTVSHTLLFKEAVYSPTTIIEVLNPCQTRHSLKGLEFGPVHELRNNYLVTHNEEVVYILDPKTLTAVAVVDNLRRIHSLCVNKDEIFIVEGPRSVVRLAFAPEPDLNSPGDAFNLMTKSLTTSLHKAVNTVLDLTNVEPMVPFITKHLDEANSEEDISKAEECFELPPVKNLPDDIAPQVIQSILNEFKDIQVENENDDLQRRLKLCDNRLNIENDPDLIFSSVRRNGSTPARRKREIHIEESTKNTTKFTEPLFMETSQVERLKTVSIESIEKEIENKEKMLAKMLDLDSLSIPKKAIQMNNSLVKKMTAESASPPKVIVKTPIERITKSKELYLNKVPEVARVPKNWNLKNLSFEKKELNLNQLQSPDDSLDREWEFV